MQQRSQRRACRSLQSLAETSYRPLAIQMDRSTEQLAKNISAECSQPFLRFPEVASATWTRLQPLTSTVQQDLQRLCAPVLDRLQPYFHQATQWTDVQLADLPPWQVAVLAIASTWLALTLYRWASNVVEDIRDVGELHSHKQCSFFIEQCALCLMFC